MGSASSYLLDPAVNVVPELRSVARTRSARTQRVAGELS